VVFKCCFTRELVVQHINSKNNSTLISVMRKLDK
jgi:hypothetical protein